jgi:hypothetical protein
MPSKQEILELLKSAGGALMRFACRIRSGRPLGGRRRVGCARLFVRDDRSANVLWFGGFASFASFRPPLALREPHGRPFFTQVPLAPRTCVRVKIRSASGCGPRRPIQQLADGGSLEAKPEQDALAVALAMHHSLPRERLQMPRGARLRKPNGFREFTHAVLAFEQAQHQLESRWVAQAGKNVARFRVSDMHCMAMHIRVSR